MIRRTCGSTRTGTRFPYTTVCLSKGRRGDLAEIDRFSGPVTLESRLTTRGTSQAALVAGLAGEGTLAGTVTAAAKAEEQAGALVIGLLGQKVKEVRGITDSTTLLFRAFAGAPATVDGSFLVEEGVLRKIGRAHV